MSSGKKLYIAGMGCITSVGGNVPMTSAAFNAGISAYKASSFITDNGQNIVMAQVPDEIFDHFDGAIEEGDRFNLAHDRIVKMAIFAIREACTVEKPEYPIPLLLGMPDVKTDNEGLVSLVENLVNNYASWLSVATCRCFYSGRASGMEAIDFAFQYLLEGLNPYILVGGSDSYGDFSRLAPLEQEGRLLARGSSDAFAPGEAASFLLLTPQPELAQQRDGQIIALSAPGIADEPGHFYSDEPYRGDGLDQAFKKALSTNPSTAFILFLVV